MTTAAAVVFSKEDTTVLDRIEVGDPAPGEVQIRTVCSMISTGTERWALRNEFTWAPTPYPCVPGYQRTGIVEQVGAGVEGIRAGDRVMATASPIIGGAIRSFWGAHAALGNTPATEVYALPDEVEFAAAAGTVVAQVGYNAASRLQLAAGDWVVVFGDGLIGHCAAQAARARGARTIMAGRRA